MSFFAQLKHFLSPIDERYEDLKKGNVVLHVLRDAVAGLVVAMVAIPMAMGIAMASGLRPEQGIIAGALAGLLGSLFGGSKYQIYGPTAAFIPIIAGIMVDHDHGFLVVCSLVAGVILLMMSFFKMGRIVKMVPHSIVVGFTIGIAIAIGLSQGGEIFGLRAHSGHGAIDKANLIVTHYGSLEIWAVVLAIGTLVLIKILMRVSKFLPGPLVALAIAVGLTQTVLKGEGLILVRDKFGTIPSQLLRFTPPSFANISGQIGSVLYFAIAIVFVAAIESLLCARLADRLANNKGATYDPDKELWGQANLMLWVPLFNGFPSTGALARTATNIKLGAISPFAGICMSVFKIAMAFYLARYLELVPMACIGGILLYVATNMVKASEIKEVVEMGRGHTWLMVYTAFAVVGMDFLRGVLSALVIYGIWQVVVKSRSSSMDAHADHAPDDSHAAVVVHAPHASVDHLRATIGAKLGTPDVSAVTGRSTWLANIRRPGATSRSAYIHRQANVAGRVVLGDHVHIAAGSSVRADEGSPFHIGSNTNIQDGVVIHALKDKHVLVDGEAWAVFVGKNVSIAHDALVHGPCFVGDRTFIGFKAVVHDAVVGAGCFLGIGSIVVGVEVPEGRYVAPGTIVDSHAKANALPPATDAHRHFNEDVVEVNRGLAAAYREHTGNREHPGNREHSGGSTSPHLSSLRPDTSMDVGWDPPEPAMDRF